MLFIPEAFQQQFGPIKKLNYKGAGSTNIFMSEPVRKSGKLVSVEYFAVQKGKFFIGGWKHLANDSSHVVKVWEIMVECQQKGGNIQVSCFISTV